MGSDVGRQSTGYLAYGHGFQQQRYHDSEQPSLDTVHVSRQFFSRLPQRLRQTRAAPSSESRRSAVTSFRFLRETTLAPPSPIGQQAAMPWRLASPTSAVSPRWVGATVPLFVRPAISSHQNTRAKNLSSEQGVLGLFGVIY
jgi:hypothetical protein